MSAPTADVVICGAGIAGVAAAYHLAVRLGVSDVVLVDERPPLSLTSDKSTECYRNLWPGPGDAMVAAMNRSIDLLDEPARVGRFIADAHEAAALGSGAARVHASAASDYRPAPGDAFENQPDGVDV